jgi:predicted PurR-regulated permease PerM
MPTLEKQRSRRHAMAILLGVAFVLVAYVAAPMWVGLMLGTVLAFTFQPLYERVATILGRRSLSAGLVTLVAGVAAAALGAAALYVVTDELVTIVKLLQKHANGATLADMIGARAARTIEHLGFAPDHVVDRIHAELGRAEASVAAAAGVAAQTVTNGVLSLIVAIITMYYVLLEWPRVTRRVETILPIDPVHTRAIMRELRDVGRGALVGTLATAILQGALAEIGYALSGVPQALTWATLTALASFMPIVGTTVVWIPVGIYMIMTGHVAAGIFVIAWGALVVSALSDYVIRPRIVGKSGGGHPLMMLVALLGGIEVFGLAGLIVGPVLMSLFVAILRIYERQVTA